MFLSTFQKKLLFFLTISSRIFLKFPISQNVMEKAVELLSIVTPLLQAVTESLNLLNQSGMGWCSPLAPPSSDAGRVTRLCSPSSPVDFAALYRTEDTSSLFLPYWKSFPSRERIFLSLPLSLLLYFLFFNGVATVMGMTEFNGFFK